MTNSTPNPKSSLLDNYNFLVDPNGLANFVQFYLKEQYGRYDPRRLVRTYSLYDEELWLVAEEHDKSQQRYYLFNWKYKHRAWLSSSLPVFLDFGDELLYWIKRREQQPVPLLYLQAVKKKDFLSKYTQMENNS